MSRDRLVIGPFVRYYGTVWAFEPWRVPLLDPLVSAWTRLVYCRRHGHRPGFDSPTICKVCGTTLERR